MTMRRTLLLALLLLASPARATILVPMTDADLVATSDAILTGTVMRIRTIARHGGAIHTEITLQMMMRITGRRRGLALPGRGTGGGVPRAPVELRTRTMTEPRGVPARVATKARTPCTEPGRCPMG